MLYFNNSGIYVKDKKNLNSRLYLHKTQDFVVMSFYSGI